jgi:hypothetical protein
MRLTELIQGHARREPRERRPRRTARLRPAAILAAAARAGYRDWRPVLAAAIPVSLLSAGAEMLTDHYIDPADAALSLTAALSATGVSLAGTVLLSGLVCRLISAAERGKAAMTIPQMARSLPWGRLIAADLLVSLAVLAGLVLLVIPGLVMLTLFAVVGPVIEIEHHKVFAAMRRSVRLTRAHPWTTLLVATVPLALTAEVEAVAPEPHHAAEIAGFLILRGAAEGIMEACIALILVELCFALIGAQPPAAAAAGGGTPGDDVTAGLPPPETGQYATVGDRFHRGCSAWAAWRRD